jgi:hypothetical protein
MSLPTDKQVLDAVRAIRSKTPGMGRAKVLAKLTEENKWTLSENRLKKLLNANNLKREAEPSKKEPGLIELPNDAHAALLRY